MSDKLLDTVNGSSPLATDPLPALVSPKQRKQEDSAVLKLKGLPYTASSHQIYEFFAGFNVNEVAFVYEPDGRPSGLAFAEFASREEALQAMGKKNGEYLGDRYVRLLHVPKHEMEEQVRLGTLAIPGSAAKMRQRAMRGPGLDMPGAGLDGSQLYQHGPRQQRPMGDGGPGGFRNPQQQQQQGGVQLQHVGPLMPGMPGPGRPGLQHLGPGLMPPGAELGPGNAAMGMAGMPPPMALAYQLGNMQLGGSGPRPGPGMMGMPGMPGMMPSFGPQGVPAGPPVVIGTESKTIKIRGLPFRATPIDIFNFFEGYEVVAESLQLGVDALGRPSGEAWLTFASSDEALRAVRERNRHYLGNRYLELSLT